MSGSSPNESSKHREQHRVHSRRYRQRLRERIVLLDAQLKSLKEENALLSSIVDFIEAESSEITAHSQVQPVEDHYCDDCLVDLLCEAYESMSDTSEGQNNS